MRSIRHACCIAILSLTASAQGLPESSFIVKLKYIKLDQQSSSKTACMAVFPDGRFHMEQSSQWPVSDRLVFEDSLSNESRKSLSAILESDLLKGLTGIDKGPFPKFVRGEVVWAKIARIDAIQSLLFAGWEGSVRVPPKGIPPSLDALVEWAQATGRAVNSQKTRPIKHAKLNNCWIAN